MLRRARTVSSGKTGQFKLAKVGQFGADFPANEDGCNIVAKDSKVTVTAKGITVIKGDSGLKKTLESLIDAITKLTVSTALGPSSPPINAADFVKIKKDLSNYLEN